VLKTNKTIPALLVALLISTFLPMAVFAQNVTLDLGSSNGKIGNKITISGTADSDEWISIKIVDVQGNIVYYDAVKSGIDGKYSNTFKIPDTKGETLTVVAGYGSNVDTKTLKVDTTDDEEDNTQRPSDDDDDDEEDKTQGSGSGSGDAFSGSTMTIQISGGSFERYGANIFIPKDAFEEKIKIKIEKFMNTSGLPIPKNARLASDVIEIIKDKIGDFKKPVTITLRYEKNKYDTAKYDLAIYWLDESKGRWEKLGNISVDEEKGIVEGETEHFTKFAVLAVEKDTEQEKLEEPEQFTILLTDIEGHWAEEFIMTLVNLDAIKGYPDNTFKPNNNITRAEFATVLVRAFSPETKSDRVFADTKSHWAKDFIATAAANGIVLGYDENTFGPDDLITREQMAVMITRALKISFQDSNIAFADKANISAWAKDSVTAAVEKGIIEGYPDNTFKPLGKATRAEAVTVIVKALQ